MKKNFLQSLSKLPNSSRREFKRENRQLLFLPNEFWQKNTL